MAPSNGYGNGSSNGYVPPNAPSSQSPSSSSVVFSVQCSSTRPGEAVFVTSSLDAMGCWKPALALPLSTTADVWPIWSSEPMPLPETEALEYKYLIQREDRSGAARWESFAGNHRVKAQSCKVLKASSAWDKQPSEVIVLSEGTPNLLQKRSSTSSSKEDQDKVRQAQEQTLLVMAESSVDTAAAEVSAACPLAVTLADRESMRRNFSQSLLCLDDVSQTGDVAKDVEAEPVTPPGSKATAVVQTLCSGSSDEDLSDKAKTSRREKQTRQSKTNRREKQKERRALKRAELRGVPLQHIMSFSALVEMAPPEEKDEHRKGKKVAQSTYEPFNLDVPVVIVTSEVAPYSKTGGLGLVAASYSYEFARNGHRTMVVSPKYKHYEGINYIGETRVRVDDREELVKYFHKRVDIGEGNGTDFLFIEHHTLERDGGLYNGSDGREYHDNLTRFTLLSLAAMEAPLILDINGQGKYGEKILFLANDWQSGLVPVQLCYKYRRNGCYCDARCIYVIHNLGYQGEYPRVNASRFFGIDNQAASDVALGNCVNLSKGALVCADRVLTVSPNYAKEIQTPAGGFKLQDFVSAKAHGRRLGGILNGIDDCWDPLTDQHLERNYTLDDFVEGKAANKAALQKELGLDEDPQACLMGFVGRLTWQKGVDVLVSIIDWLMQDGGNGVTGNIQLIMMGNGEKHLSDCLRNAEERYKGKVCGYVGFDPAVEHQMMAGCDLFVMPSRYEPCGLPQMYSQVYGTLPIVTATGGLVDSVKDFSAGVDVATGFHIPHLAADKLKEIVYKAAEIVLKRPQDFQRMQSTAMSSDYYWPKAMDEYEKTIDVALYEAPTVR
eukprot:TRINITY_DN4754_c0_g3_i1.p1 TRINITY_DN4754_c0_g3~~TRINITY_DN4754_c0_g3_i1.p1  ORF type:complete len:836 (+),score=119.74 TRINITY_DN4754_c0_g3_i1:85-2592(+)